MKQTIVNLNKNLLKQAQALSGITDLSRLIDHALHRLIGQEAARRLSALGGTMPGAKAGPRRRSKLPGA